MRPTKPVLGLWAAIACMGSCTISFAADAGVSILGLPLGGQLEPAPKVCTIEEITSNTNKVPCWVSKPYLYKKEGSKLGSLHMPSPERLPEWVGYSALKAHVSKHGVLEELAVESLDGNLKHVIANSISKRFGLPVETTLPRREWAEATWRSEGIEVFQRCTVKSCEVRFSSPAAIKRRTNEQAEAKRIDAERPAAP